ncbi:MAG: transglutaminase-like domain-containing protein [Patescibacteria group bacterium]
MKTKIFAILLLLGLVGFLVHMSSPIKPRRSLALAMLDFLAQPKFSSENLMAQLTGTEAELEILDLDSRMLYLSFPKAKLLSDLRKVCSLPLEDVEMGEERGDLAHLGKYQYTQKGRRLVCFPMENFVINSEAKIVVPYPSVKFETTPQELADFMDNKSVIGGKYFFSEYVDGRGIDHVIANFGSVVGKKGEPSLSRLAKNLVKGEIKPEKIAQKLLDFVSTEIEYDPEEIQWANSRQVIKKPEETLLTKTGTCGAKAVLLASLLEQYEIPYYLGYYPSHVTVLVAGDFVPSNELSFPIGEKVYHVAESTSAGFLIGKSRVVNINLGKNNLTYLTRPCDGQLLILPKK